MLWAPAVTGRGGTIGGTEPAMWMEVGWPGALHGGASALVSPAFVARPGDDTSAQIRVEVRVCGDVTSELRAVLVPAVTSVEDVTGTGTGTRPGHVKASDADTGRMQRNHT